MYFFLYKKETIFLISFNIYSRVLPVLTCAIALFDISELFDSGEIYW